MPVLVHDGKVHIESNDIITYLEKTFPEPRLIPAGHENEVAALLKHEDDLHLDLRTLSFRFVFDPPGPPKPAEALAELRRQRLGHGAGPEADRDKEIQIEFWQRAAKEGFTDERARASAQKFRAEFDALDQRLAKQPYLMGESAERARHRLVHLCAPAVARRLSVRAAAPAGRGLVEQALGAAGVRQGNRGAAAGHGAHRGERASARGGSGKTLEAVAGF